MKFIHEHDLKQAILSDSGIGTEKFIVLNGGRNSYQG